MNLSSLSPQNRRTRSETISQNFDKFKNQPKITRVINNLLLKCNYSNKNIRQIQLYLYSSLFLFLPITRKWESFNFLDKNQRNEMMYNSNRTQRAYREQKKLIKWSSSKFKSYWSSRNLKGKLPTDKKYLQNIRTWKNLNPEYIKNS